MKQIVQNARSGEFGLEMAPDPRVGQGHLPVRTRAPLVSAGTERMMAEFARKSLFEKARAPGSGPQDKRPSRTPPFRDGRSADRIVSVLTERLWAMKPRQQDAA